MSPWLIALQVFDAAALVAAVTLLLIVRRGVASYGAEKGKNLATKEDVGEITRRIETVRTSYAAELERLRVTLTATAAVHRAQYEAEVATYTAVWEKIMVLHGALYGVWGQRSAMDHADLEGQSAADAARFVGAVLAFRQEVERRRPFYPNAVYNELLALDDMITDLGTPYLPPVPVPYRARRGPGSVDLEVVAAQVDRVCEVIRGRLAHVAFESPASASAEIGNRSA